MTVYLMKAMFNLGQDSEKIKMKIIVFNTI